MKARQIIVLLAALAAGISGAADFSQHIKCELQSATGSSLPTKTIMQGTTPLWSLDQYSNGQSVNAATDSSVRAVIIIASNATASSFAVITNQSVLGNGYLVQWPVVGTNSGGANSDPWWYTVLYQTTNGTTYWTGAGQLVIEPTSWTGQDGLGWGVGTNNYAVLIAAETIRATAAEAVASTNLTAYINYLNAIALTNWGAAVALAQATGNQGLTNWVAVTTALAAQNLATSNAVPGIVGGILLTGNVATATYATTAGSASNAPWSGLTGTQPKLSAVTNADTVTTITGSQIAAAGGLTNAAAFDPAGAAAGVTAASIGAAEAMTPLSEFTWTTNGNSQIVITRYIGSAVFVYPPPTINGLPVYTIGEGAFSNNATLRVFLAPPYLDSISTNAFFGCTSLVYVRLSFTELITIGPGAFAGCTGLPSLRVPVCVQTIGAGALSNCTALTEVEFEGSLPTCGTNILYGTSANVYRVSGCSGFSSTLDGRPVIIWGERALVTEGIIGPDGSTNRPHGATGIIPALPLPTLTQLGVPGLIASSNAPIVAAVASNTAAIAANTPALIYDATGNGLTLASTNRWQEYSVYLTNNWTITIAPAMTAGQRFDLAVAHSTSNQVMAWPAGVVCQTASTGVTFTNTTGFTDWYTISCRGTNATVGVTKTNLFQLAGTAN